MRSAKTQTELAKRMSAYLKARIRDAGLTHAELAEKMARYGYADETDESVRAKLKRGTFSGAFLVAALAAIGRDSISLKDI